MVGRLELGGIGILELEGGRLEGGSVGFGELVRTMTGPCPSTYCARASRGMMIWNRILGFLQLVKVKICWEVGVF